MNKDFEKHINGILKELDYKNVNIIIQIPKNLDHGDLSTPVAMSIAKNEGKKVIYVEGKTSLGEIVI